MERLPIDPVEVELRHNRDFIDSMRMIAEGAPIYERFEEDEPVEKKWRERGDFGAEELPRDYQ
ncbi:hypothetical protein [Sporosarcina sp. YIM B06819]|uniref:hypothetical protein n=1 Tax=Sporosarcina sp. YIM B06819 TaxID=3081769 RepID=UPI00298BEAE8|nr:hypothetical protein [Sporosarcina sp. YIM B06819]